MGKGPAAFAGFVLLDVVAPPALYYLLRLAGVSIWTALVAGVALPLLRLGASVLFRRHVPRASIFTLTLILIGTLTGLVTADARLLMARESYITAVVGGWFLLSLLRSRPLIFTTTVDFMPEQAARDWHRSWMTSAVFRRAMRGMTWRFAPGVPHRCGRSGRDVLHPAAGLGPAGLRGAADGDAGGGRAGGQGLGAATAAPRPAE